MQCAWQLDTSFPRDALVITPHFNDQGVGSDPEGLANDLADALNGWEPGSVPLKIKVYDAQGTVPVYPVAEVTRNGPAVPLAGANREVAVCLSFYAGSNRPRHRGRLYIPAPVAGMALTGSRPSAGVQQKAADLVPLFADLGGADVDWCVYSRLDDTARSVSHWWVDNAWDVQRRRGLQPTARLEGDVGE